MSRHSDWVRPQVSLSVDSVGEAAQQKRSEVVCVTEKHLGQASVSVRPISCRLEFSLDTVRISAGQVWSEMVEGVEIQKARSREVGFGDSYWANGVN